MAVAVLIEKYDPLWEQRSRRLWFAARVLYLTLLQERRCPIDGLLRKRMPAGGRAGKYCLVGYVSLVICFSSDRSWSAYDVVASYNTPALVLAAHRERKSPGEAFREMPRACRSIVLAQA